MACLCHIQTRLTTSTTLEGIFTDWLCCAVPYRALIKYVLEALEYVRAQLKQEDELWEKFNKLSIQDGETDKME